MQFHSCQCNISIVLNMLTFTTHFCPFKGMSAAIEIPFQTPVNDFYMAQTINTKLTFRVLLITKLTYLG